MPISKNIVDALVKATERGAYGASLYKGKNDKIAADQSAVDEMRRQLNKINMNGRIVIGEGEMDEAPMLYINEEVGTKKGEQLDIAVDPLEGTNFTAKNLPNALSVLAATEKGNLLHAPDMYMEKIAVGPNLPDKLIDLDYGVEKNIKRLAEAKKVKLNEITACLLKRPRHDSIVKILNEMNVNIKFISDGDVSGVISVAYQSKKIDIYLGIGGGPEGVLAAAALKCLGCQMQTRLFFQDKNDENRAKDLGIKNLNIKYNINDMVKGDVVFCATGVTDGDFVKGIKDANNFFLSETLLLHENSKINRIIKNKNIK